MTAPSENGQKAKEEPSACQEQSVPIDFDLSEWGHAGQSFCQMRCGEQHRCRPGNDEERVRDVLDLYIDRCAELGKDLIQRSAVGFHDPADSCVGTVPFISEHTEQVGVPGGDVHKINDQLPREFFGRLNVRELQPLDAERTKRPEQEVDGRLTARLSTQSGT